MKKVCLYLFTAMFLLCCGDNDDDNNTNNSGNNTQAQTFNCGQNATMCTAGQYCLVSQIDSVESAAECVNLPAACGADSCECAADDAPNESVACDRALIASSCVNTSITITCNRSSLGL